MIQYLSVQCRYALEGLTQLLNTIKLTQNHFNKKLSIEGLLLNNVRSTIHKLGLEVSQKCKDILKKKFIKLLFKNIKLSEAPSAGMYF